MSNKKFDLVADAAHELAEARSEVVNTLVRAYGAERRYALALNATFSNDWFNIEANDKSAEAAPFNTEKSAFYQMLRDAKHTNPSTVMARIRKYGKEARYPAPDMSEGEGAGEGAGEGEGEGEGAGRGERSPMLRNSEELTRLYKFNAKLEVCPEKIAACQEYIVKALEALGLDVRTIPT
jgi:hypothetical protein